MLKVYDILKRKNIKLEIHAGYFNEQYIVKRSSYFKFVEIVQRSILFKKKQKQKS